MAACINSIISIIVFIYAGKVIIFPSPQSSNILFDIVFQYPFNCFVCSFHYFKIKVICIPSCSSPPSDIIISIVLLYWGGNHTPPLLLRAEKLKLLGLTLYWLIISWVFFIYLFYSIKASCYTRTTISCCWVVRVM